jgi:Tol biopolymer transport system component
VGERSTIGSPNLKRYRTARVLPNGRTVVFSASADGESFRLYAQEIGGGSPPRPICRDGMIGPTGVSPDGEFVLALGVADRSTWLCPTAAKTAEQVGGLTADDFPVQWSEDGQAIFIRRRGGERPLRVTKFDLRTRRREPFMEVMPADPAGVASIPGIFMTPSAKAYVYTYLRVQTELYVMTNLK